MTTSGTSSFNLTRDQIITAALRKLGAIQSGETPDAQLVTDCAQQLNSLVKSLAGTGLHVWTEAEATLFLQPNQTSYQFGTGATDHCTETYTATTLSSAAAAGASTISVSSASGITNGYNIGIQLDSGLIYWTTVNGAPSGTTITLTAVTTDSASSGNAVYCYQSNIIRPLKVVSARRYNYASALDTQMLQLSRIDYRNMPNKTNTGVITQWFYDPRGGANATGVMWIWPAPQDNTNAVKFTWWRPLQDFTSAANNPDLPVEWLEALIWNLAWRMAPEFDQGPGQPRYEGIKEMAQITLDVAAGFDREPESYLFGFNADQVQGY